MKRTRKNQLDSLINHTEDKKHKNIFKTRGSNPLIQSIEPKLKKMNTNRHVNDKNGLKPLLFIIVIMMIAISVLLNFNIYFNLGLAISASWLAWILTKNEKKILHSVNVVEEKINYITIIENNEYEINEHIKKSLIHINDNLNYLLNLENLINQNINHLHYVKMCKEKHINDIIRNLILTHDLHKEKIEILVINQLSNINQNLEKIITEYQNGIENNIKVKEIFKPD